jgi:cytochrome c2
MKHAALIFVVTPGLLPAADAQRGATLIRENRCLECHSVRGDGARLAPDLALRPAGDFTPAALASAIWNHAPEMGPRAVPPRPFTESAGEDLFFFLYSLRYYDSPGFARRGEQTLNKKGCTDCHSLGAEGKGPGTPLPQWKALGDPIALVQRMWNHSGPMQSAAAERSRRWPELTAQDLLDIAAFSGTPGRRGEPLSALPDPSAGRRWFDAQCRHCHRGTLALEARLSNTTFFEIAASMWNHIPRMLATPMPTADEMAGVIAYVWELQYLGPPGNAARGREAFEKKGCAGCHNDPVTGASRMARGERVFTPSSMITLGWIHTGELRRAFPRTRLSARDIADLAAYMNTRQ